MVIFDFFGCRHWVDDAFFDWFLLLSLRFFADAIDDIYRLISHDFILFSLLAAFEVIFFISFRFLILRSFSAAAIFLYAFIISLGFSSPGFVFDSHSTDCCISFWWPLVIFFTLIFYDFCRLILNISFDFHCWGFLCCYVVAAAYYCQLMPFHFSFWSLFSPFSDFHDWLFLIITLIDTDSLMPLLILRYFRFHWWYYFRWLLRCWYIALIRR